MWETENILLSSLLENSRSIVSANDIYNVMKNVQAKSDKKYKHIHHTDSFEKGAKGFNTNHIAICTLTFKLLSYS